MTSYLPDDCAFCIDGNMPAGIHDILGTVCRPCPVCLIVCRFCDGDGIFPTDFTCVECFRIRMATISLAPVLCAHCFGVVDIIPLDTAEEVNRHVHHDR